MNFTRSSRCDVTLWLPGTVRRPRHGPRRERAQGGARRKGSPRQGNDPGGLTTSQEIAPIGALFRPSPSGGMIGRTGGIPRRIVSSCCHRHISRSLRRTRRRPGRRPRRPRHGLNPVQTTSEIQDGPIGSSALSRASPSSRAFVEVQPSCQTRGYLASGGERHNSRNSACR